MLARTYFVRFALSVMYNSVIFVTTCIMFILIFTLTILIIIFIYETKLQQFFIIIFLYIVVKINYNFSCVNFAAAKVFVCAMFIIKKKLIFMLFTHKLSL